MSEQHPTCPACSYDLTGTHQPGTIEPCPECGRKVSYQRATEHPKHPRTILLALVLVLILPSLWMSIFWAQLNVGNSLDGALVPYFSGLLFFLYLPITSAVLLIRDWRRRVLINQSGQGFQQVLMTLFIFLFFALLWNWYVLAQWVEGVANV